MEILDKMNLYQYHRKGIDDIYVISYNENNALNKAKEYDKYYNHYGKIKLIKENITFLV